VNTAQAAYAFSQKADRCFLNAPIHAGKFLPDVDRLLGGKAVAETVPRFCADVGHLLDEVSHVELLKDERIKPGRSRASEKSREKERGKSAARREGLGMLQAEGVAAAMAEVSQPSHMSMSITKKHCLLLLK
jgi:hypothetical protein